MDEIPEVLLVVEQEVLFWVVIAPSPDKIRHWSISKAEASDEIGALAAFYEQWNRWEFAEYKRRVLSRPLALNLLNLEGT